jgi:hypothetical protein
MENKDSINEILNKIKEINFESLDLTKEYSNNDITLNSTILDNKFVFDLKGTLPKKSDNYIDYFWNPELFLSVNTNIINSIDVLENNESNLIIKTNYNIKTTNMNVCNNVRTEKMILDKKNDGFVIYSKILDSDDENSIKNGYSILKFIDYEDKTLFVIQTYFETSFPKMFKKVLGILLIKIILNILDYDK